MRFLKFWDNGDYCLTNHLQEPIPIYGILSHRWGAAGDEITYEEIKDGTRRSINEDDLARPGFRKIQFCRERADDDGLRYFWIDTCCIDKQNEVELSHALNSMFYWYQQAARCYVYLSDVSSPMGQDSTFESSEWFTRGWTLQELVAPESVVFYSSEGLRLGDKSSLSEQIHRTTRIPVKALKGLSSMNMFSVNERFQWAEGRHTTKPEDMAYCLLGIFNVRMTPIYADGEYDQLRHKAITELKEKTKNQRESEEIVVAIGGAYWSDLQAIDSSRLQELDREIRNYTIWLLEQGTSGSRRALQEMSIDAGIKMKDLLKKFDIQYNDESNLHEKGMGWEDPWRRFKHHTSKFERVRGFLENRWVIGNKPEDCYTGMMAAKTLLGLILWRDLKDLM
jgi:hypothetical protein